MLKWCNAKRVSHWAKRVCLWTNVRQKVYFLFLILSHNRLRVIMYNIQHCSACTWLWHNLTAASDKWLWLHGSWRSVLWNLSSVRTRAKLHSGPSENCGETNIVSQNIRVDNSTSMCIFHSRTLTDWWEANRSRLDQSNQYTGGHPCLPNQGGCHNPAARVKGVWINFGYWKLTIR